MTDKYSRFKGRGLIAREPPFVIKIGLRSIWIIGDNLCLIMGLLVYWCHFLALLLN